jgi:hypothetical protein
MSRARPKSSAMSKPSSPEALPDPVAPQRKHPWRLALAVVLLLAWLIFMAAMAWRD